MYRIKWSRFHCLATSMFVMCLEPFPPHLKVLTARPFPTLKVPHMCPPPLRDRSPRSHQPLQPRRKGRRWLYKKSSFTTGHHDGTNLPRSWGGPGSVSGRAASYCVHTDVITEHLARDLVPSGAITRGTRDTRSRTVGTPVLAVSWGLPVYNYLNLCSIYVWDGSAY